MLRMLMCSYLSKGGYMSTLSIDTDNTKSVSVMKVKGRVDSDTTPEFEHALLQLLGDNRNKIVLNLQAVEFLSSAGLRAMVKALKDAQKSGGDVRLASVSQPIEVILRTVGMLQMFKMFSTSEEAAAGF
jgi:anti-sigma B factor antagonist